MTATVTSPDGRTIGFDDQEPPDGIAVLWCHGGPGSRLEPVWLRDEAAAAGLRIVGVDRPGYGLSTPRPGRTIADTVADLLAVADHLAIEQFVTVGVSTGGAYALATAALAPSRVLGVVACRAVTDMAFQPARGDDASARRSMPSGTRPLVTRRSRPRVRHTARTATSSSTVE